jgi:putative endonuclease
VSTTRRAVPVEQWKDPRQLLGVWGERIALAYLSARGWIIEAHRFRFGRHEIDVIARCDQLVAFVEVKTRRTSGFGSGLEAVGGRKQRTVARVAAVWKLRYGRPGYSYRFDVIAIQQPERDGNYAVEHLEDAWRLK